MSEVLLAGASVTVNAETSAAWTHLVPQTSAILTEALHCGPVSPKAVQALAELAGTCSAAWPAGSVEAEIVEVLDVHVRPYVREDGGDLRFCAFDHERGVARQPGSLNVWRPEEHCKCAAWGH